MIGQQVGDYKILKQIGEEAMGMVYLGEHPMLKQKVAVKALDPKLVTTEGMRERFEREAQVLARLNHPNIIRLLNFHNLPEGCFIVMEFAEGETLEDMVTRAGPVAIPQAVAWVIQVLRALHHAHTLEIVHRDMKPANVMVTTAGVPKVLDFGLAKVADGPQLTMQGLTLGTPYYMSVEQLLGKKLDARSDIYSCGVLLYEITTGKLPFDDEEEKKLVLKIAKQDPPAPTKLVPGFPPELEKIILKAMMKDANKRYQTAEEMAVALEAFASGNAAPAWADPSSNAAKSRPGTSPGFAVPAEAAKPATARFSGIPDAAIIPAPPPPPPPPPPAAPAYRAPAPVAAPVAGAPSIVGPFLIVGLCVLMGSIGGGVATAILAPEQKLALALAFGVGCPVGIVLTVVAVLRSVVGAPKA